MKAFFPAIFICFVVAAVGASVQGEDAPKKATVLNVGGIDSKNGAVIAGIVRFKGIKPELKPISEIAGAAFCKSCYAAGELPLHDDFVFGKNGADDTLANVLVYVSKGLDGKTFDVPKEPAVLDQVGCMYTPHVVAVMVGQTLEIRNSDATLHNVMAMPRHNPPFNFGMPVKDQVTAKVFKKSEFKMNLRCFMHPWMSAYVHVLEHPFFAITGEDGTFTIKGLPPGEYEISVLHESSALVPAPATASVKVIAGKSQSVDFAYSFAKP
jgi:plastocyanin